MGAVSRWQEYARQYGWGGLVRYLARRVLRPVWEASSAYLLVMQPPAPAVTAKIDLRVGLLTREISAPNFEWERRWAQGDLCYAAWRGDQLVHHSWVAQRDTYLAEVHGWVRLQPGEAYVYDCFTDGSCRGLGIFPAVLSHIGQALFAGNIRRIWIAVEEENRSSLKAIQRAGFEPAGEVAYRRVGAKGNRAVKPEPGAPPFRVE
jgi:GNAT superfamily N-acetyltransferase